MSTRKWDFYDVEFFDGEMRFDELEFRSDAPFITSHDGDASLIVNLIEDDKDDFDDYIDINVSVSLSQIFDNYIDCCMRPDMADKRDSDIARESILAALKREIKKIESFEYIEKEALT